MPRQYMNTKELAEYVGQPKNTVVGYANRYDTFPKPSVFVGKAMGWSDADAKKVLAWFAKRTLSKLRPPI